MATVINNSLEGGTDGIAVTTGNSGGASGTAFDSVGGTGLKYSASEAILGSMGATVAASAAGYVGFLPSNITHVATKHYFTPKATATSDTHIMRIQTSGTRIFSVHIVGSGVSSGKLRIDDNTGTAGVFTFANALTNGTHYRLEVYAVCGSTTSNGTIKVAYYVGSSTTPVETAYSVTNANLGAGLTFNQVYMGKFSITSEAMGMDDFSISYDATDFIGIPAATPPTVSTPAVQNVAAAAAVTVSVTASGNGGATISSYAWSYLYPASGGPTLSGATTNTVSFTAGSAGALYQLQCVVTDSNTQTTTVSTEVRVPTSGDFVALGGAAWASVGSWSNVGGAADPGTAVSDSSDTTYTESATLTSTETSERFRLQPLTARSTLTLTTRLEQNTTGSTSSIVRLYEGATLRQTWNVSNTPALATTTAWQDIALVVTSPGAITDWGNLYVEGGFTSP